MYIHTQYHLKISSKTTNTQQQIHCKMSKTSAWKTIKTTKNYKTTFRHNLKTTQTNWVINVHVLKNSALLRFQTSSDLSMDLAHSQSKCQKFPTLHPLRNFYSKT